ncbi:MAG: hypothetical protein C0475_04230 [Planctomyces sp.]|nr:hypothetical protein [Planctomyces sp.]
MTPAPSHTLATPEAPANALALARTPAPEAHEPAPEARQPAPEHAAMPRTTPEHATPSLCPAPPADVPPLDVAAKAVYMIGIGGCGMSGLARMLRARGAAVSGSDMTPSDATDALMAEGVAVGFDQSRAWIPDDTALVVASAAVRPEHPQVRAAAARGVPVLSYAQALGRSMIGRTGVAIAGTHGKSTTTAMLSAVLCDAGIDPTVIVGATCAQLGGAVGGGGGAAPAGFRLGAERIAAGSMRGAPGVVLAEACEFNRSFLNFRPSLAAINAVEADHLDIYGTLDEVVRAFGQFARLVAPAHEGGLLIIAHQGAHRREVTAGVGARVLTIGASSAADLTVWHDPATGRCALSGSHDGAPRRTLCQWTAQMPGEHNATNAATAAALALALGADAEVVGRSLSAFAGVDRRCQFLGEQRLASGGSVRVYDDYGHHPTEVDTTLRALRRAESPESRGGRIVCVFQPHQHSRTRHLLEEFARSFEAADVVIVPHIYFVRDSQEERSLVSAADLVDRLRQRGVRAMHLYPFEAIVEQLRAVCRDGDVVVVMGAGPVYQVARGFMQP